MVVTASFAVLAKNKVMVDANVDAANLYLLLDPKIKSETSRTKRFPLIRD